MININSHASLSTPDWRQEFKRLEGAYAPATLRAYYTDVQKFADYCDVEELKPFPANADTVCAFIAAQGVDLRPGSVRRSLYAIRKIHQLLHLPDPTTDEDWSVVDVEPVVALPKPVTLAAIKADSTLAEMAMLKRSRLSVVPVTSEEFAHILHMGACKLSRRVKT